MRFLVVVGILIIAFDNLLIVWILKYANLWLKWLSINCQNSCTIPHCPGFLHPRFRGVNENLSNESLLNQFSTFVNYITPTTPTISKKCSRWGDNFSLTNILIFTQRVCTAWRWFHTLKTRFSKQIFTLYVKGYPLFIVFLPLLILE